MKKEFILVLKILNPQKDKRRFNISGMHGWQTETEISLSLILLEMVTMDILLELPYEIRLATALFQM